MKKGFLKKYSLISLILCLCLGFFTPMISGCTSSSEATAPPVMNVEEPITKSWTVMVYVASDNNLEANALLDILEMEQAGSNDSVAIIVQWDNGGKIATQYKGCRRILITRNVLSELPAVSNMTTNTKFQSPVIQNLGTVNSGDPDTLQKFIEWGVENYPASKYAVILWNHGSGWRYSPNPQKERDVCFDDSTGDSLTPTEVKRVFDAVHGKMSERLEIVGYDACLSSMIEEAYNYIGLAKYFVASMAIEPGDGWPYHYFLNDLRKDSSMNGRQLSADIVSRYGQFYTDSGNKSTTLVSVDTSRLSALTSAISDFASEAVSSIDSEGQNLKTANSSTPPTDEDYEDYKDIHLLMTNISSSVSSSTLKAYANSVRNAVNDAVVYTAIGEDVTANTGGLAIWVPNNNLYSTFESNYSGLPFVLNSTWNDFLKVFIVQ